MYNPDLHRLLADARSDDFKRAAATVRARRARRVAAPVPSRAIPLEVTLRFAFPDDAAAVVRLAQLDCAEPPAGPQLVAEVGGELWAALSLSDGSVIADPFRFTKPVIELLRARAAQLTAAAPGSGRNAWWRALAARLAWR